MRVQGHTVLGPFDTAEEAAEGLLEFLEGLLVPPSGVEPELPSEPDFESGASTNSAKGAAEVKTSGSIPPLMQRTLAEIKLPFGWGLEAQQWIGATDWSGHLRDEYQVRITCGPTYDNMTGDHMAGWNGRWWRLSQHMTPGEIVQTVFKATMTALEHEAREMFLYKGVPVLDPHYDIDKLVEFRRDPASILGRS